MDNIVEIHFDYLYYSKRRVTPVFVSVDELLSFTYDEFYSRMLQEVPHIAKMVLPAESLRMILTEENRPEIDLSQKYFKSQITRLLNKGLRTIVIRVAANESPLPAASRKTPNSVEEPKSKRCLDVDINQHQHNQGQGSLNFNTIINTSNSISPECVPSSQHVILPLERHVKRYDEVVRKIDGDLQQKKSELEELDGKLSTASIQNSGQLSACGNCHLKLGHTRKLANLAHVSRHFRAVSFRSMLIKNHVAQILPEM